MQKQKEICGEQNTYILNRSQRRAKPYWGLMPERKCVSLCLIYVYFNFFPEH